MVIIWLWKQPPCYHKGSYFKWRIDAYGANHNHSKYHERKYDKEDGIVDIFGLHKKGNDRFEIPPLIVWKNMRKQDLFFLLIYVLNIWEYMVFFSEH